MRHLVLDNVNDPFIAKDLMETAAEGSQRLVGRDGSKPVLA